MGGLFQLLGKALTYLRNRDRKGLLNKRGLNPESMTEKDMEAEFTVIAVMQTLSTSSRFEERFLI